MYDKLKFGEGVFENMVCLFGKMQEYLIWVIQCYYGKMLMQIINDICINFVKKQLEIINYLVMDIVYELGYSSLSLFIKIFKKLMLFMLSSYCKYLISIN